MKYLFSLFFICLLILALLTKPSQQDGRVIEKRDDTASDAPALLDVEGDEDGDEDDEDDDDDDEDEDEE